MELVRYAPAKLNLYLNVLNRREDGYHNIETIFEKIDLKDRLTFFRHKDKDIIIECPQGSIPLGRDNLVYKVWDLLCRSIRTRIGIRVRIDKIIPPGAGLGGASSNAASALIALNRIFNLHLNKTELFKLGRQIGADVPFFLSGYPFAIGRGRGDDLYRLGLPDRLWHILICPYFSIATAQVYQLWNEGYVSLTKMFIDDKINFYNSLEPLVIRHYPEFKKIYLQLRRYGLCPVMSGSGASLFLVTSTRKEAEELRYVLQKEIKADIFVVRTI